MIEEFNLSNLQMTDEHGSKYLYSEQVKQFIRLLKEKNCNCKSNRQMGLDDLCWFCQSYEELAGDELK